MRVLGEEDHLVEAAGAHQHRRRIAGAVVVLLPQRRAIGLRHRDDRRAPAAGVDEDAIADDQRRFAVAPVGIHAAELLDDVDRPDLLAGRALEAGEIAAAAEHVEAIAVHGRRAARAVAAIVLDSGGRSASPRLSSRSRDRARSRTRLPRARRACRAGRPMSRTMNNRCRHR